MSNFIQLPQAGEAVPLLLHIKDVRQVKFKNRKITVLLEREGQYSKEESAQLPPKHALALYWYLHTLLEPVPLELHLN